MSRAASAVPSWLSTFAVAYFVGSAVRDRRTGLRAGLVAASVAAVASWVAYGVAEAVERNAIGAGDDVAPTPTGRD